MSWDVHFLNSRSDLVSMAIMFYSPDACGEDGSWGTEGWWNLNPGDSAYVVNTNNRYLAFYAESANGAVWSGIYGPVYVHQAAFESCVAIGDNNPNTSIVDMQLVDLDVNNWWEFVE